jgi:hypothetical protein
MLYFFRRKWWQIRNLFRWIPVIWGQFDFDYHYSIDVFKFQLEKTADFMESDKACTLDAKHRASRIRMVLRLMDKVYSEEYACEYQSQLEELYGKNALDWNFVDSGKGDGSSQMVYSYEKYSDKDLVKEIDTLKDELFLKSREKQIRAHKLLWELVEHNILGWWD